MEKICFTHSAGSLFKKISIAILLCVSSYCLFAQDLNLYNTSLSGSVSFYKGSFLSKFKTEVPPWIIPGGWRSYFFVDGANSRVGSSPSDMINNNSVTTTSGNELTTSPDGCTAENMFPWKRNYYAIYTAQSFNHPAIGQVSFGIIHGENLSVVGSDQQPVSCGGIGWDSYAAYICGSWLPNNQATNWGQQYFSNDLGPIIWPSTGYFLPNGQKSSLGVSVPSSIVADDGYLYIFYKDMSAYAATGKPPIPWEEGRRPGIKVARAPVNDALNPLAYQSFFEDATGIHWNSSLPAGFTKNLTTTFMYVYGPKASNIMEEPGVNRDYSRFSVAKVTGTNYYMGLGCYQDYDDLWMNTQGQMMPKLKVSLRYSYDLLHWFGNRVLDVTNDWTTTSFNYPIFLSSDGWSNTRIDANNFYVLGTAPRPNVINSTVYRMRVFIPSFAAQVENPFDKTIPFGNNTPEIAPNVYPNPGKGVFQLSYDLKDNATTQVTVFDMYGRQLQTGSVVHRTPGHVTESVDISNQGKGVYMFTLIVNGRKSNYKVVYQ